MVTITDIAQRLNLSTATISNALSGKGRMRDDRRRMIIQTAIDMGYDFDRIRASRTPRSIAVLVEQFATSFCTEISTGISLGALDNGYAVGFYDLALLRNDPDNPNPDPDWCRAEIQKKLEQLPPDTQGLIYVSQYPRNMTGILPPLPFPVVYAYCYVEGSTSCVNYNDEHGAYIAVQQLIGRGCRRIGMLSGPIDSIPMSKRFHGYQKALINAGLSVDLSLVRISNWHLDSAYNEAMQLLKSDPPVDGIFCQNDMMAAGAMRAIHDRGLRIPDDVAVIGFDDQIFAPLLEPSLTSMALPCREIGRQAFLQIKNQLEFRVSEPQDILLECTLVKRQSC